MKGCSREPSHLSASIVSAFTFCWAAQAAQVGVEGLEGVGWGGEVQAGVEGGQGGGGARQAEGEVSHTCTPALHLQSVLLRAL